MESKVQAKYVNLCILIKKIFLVLDKTQHLFYSSKAIRFILLLALFSQLNTIAFSALDVTFSKTFLAAKESEDPKPKEGKNPFDLFEETTFLVAEFPAITFFSSEIMNTFHNDFSVCEVIKSLDSPPPEMV